MNLDGIKKFNWSSLKRYTSPSAIDQLNHFLEKLPQNTNKMMLIITATVWATAGASGLFATVQTQKMTELKAEREEAAAVVPVVPKITNVLASAGEVRGFVDDVSDIYQGLEIKASGSQISISAPTTNQFGQFREAIGHVQSGGKGWRVHMDKLCVGRECEKYKLAATLKINRVDIK